MSKCVHDYSNVPIVSPIPKINEKKPKTSLRNVFF